MTPGEYLTALLLVAVVLGGAGLAGWGLRARVLPDWNGALARLAEVVIALLCLLGAAQVLGVLGILTRPALAFALAAAGAAGALGRPWCTSSHSSPSPPAVDRLGLAVCAAGCLLVTAVWLRRTLLGLDVGIGGTDSLWFHMPFAAAFADSGSITGLLHTDTEFANAFYPANSELLHAVGIVLMGDDVLSPALNMAWLGLLLLACWCVGRRAGVAPLTCLAGAALAALPTLAASQPGDAKNDVLALACLAASAAFLLERDDRRAPLLLSGLAAGIAVGTKLSFALPALLMLAVAVATATRGSRLSTGGVWGLAAALPACVWFARNLAATGNPLPYIRDLGPITLPGPRPAPQSDAEFSLAHYLGDGGLWNRFFEPGLELAFGGAWWLVLGCAAAGLAIAVAAGPGREVRLLAAAGIGAAVAYLVTPLTAAGPEGSPVAFGVNLRYLAPSLLLGLLALPLLPQLGSRRHGIGAIVALAAVLVAGVTAGDSFPEGYRLEAAAGALALVAIVTALSLALSRGHPGTATGIAAGACVVAALAGLPLQRDHADKAYTRTAAPFTSWSAFSMERAFAWAKGVSGSRIGVVGLHGAFWQYPLARGGTSNSVRYVGARGASGSFSAIERCSTWRRALARGGYDYVVTTPRVNPWRLRGGPSPETGWTAGDPAARVVSQEGPVTVFRLDGPLDPESCP